MKLTLEPTVAAVNAAGAGAGAKTLAHCCKRCFSASVATRRGRPNDETGCMPPVRGQWLSSGDASYAHSHFENKGFSDCVERERVPFTEWFTSLAPAMTNTRKPV
jgi:hypothetical protein